MVWLVWVSNYPSSQSPGQFKHSIEKNAAFKLFMFGLFITRRRFLCRWRRMVPSAWRRIWGRTCWLATWSWWTSSNRWPSHMSVNAWSLAIARDKHDRDCTSLQLLFVCDLIFNSGIRRYLLMERWWSVLNYFQMNSHLQTWRCLQFLSSWT